MIKFSGSYGHTVETYMVQVYYLYHDLNDERKTSLYQVVFPSQVSPLPVGPEEIQTTDRLQADEILAALVPHDTRRTFSSPEATASNSSRAHSEDEVRLFLLVYIYLYVIACQHLIRKKETRNNYNKVITNDLISIIDRSISL